jgi:tRNA A-37 threonylcarbamoyl transferase component Bud32
MSVAVNDPFGIRTDVKLRCWAAALDQAEAERELRRVCNCQSLRVTAIRVSHLKPSRRCLVEYDIDAEPDGPTTLVGKIRARGADVATFDLMQKLRGAGFNELSPDGVSVPEPIGIVPAFGMWLQRKVAGVSASKALNRDGDKALARRIADAIHKLHRTELPISRCHTPADELGILNEMLADLVRMHPNWHRRIARLRDSCEELAADIQTGVSTVIHRDFYPAQVIVNEDRLYLLDFDLCCTGDPALDAGNFVAHLTEQSVRSYSDPACLSELEMVFADRFIELSGEHLRPRLGVYAILTLVRHVALSVRLPERRPWTPRLLELCERKLTERSTNLAHHECVSRFS